MGEFALYNRKPVKIGTCDSMYYLRYEDRKKVMPIEGNVNPAITSGLRFRLPYPDEDHIQPGGDYPPFRGLPLHLFNDSDLSDQPGLIQLRHESGLMINAACHHGERLPEGNDILRAFWNGKAGYFYELAFIKNHGFVILPIIKCRFCGEMWRSDWESVLPYVDDPEMKKRLTDYHLENQRDKVTI